MLAAKVDPILTALKAGDPSEMSELAVLQAALEKHRPARLAPQQESSIERWSNDVKCCTTGRRQSQTT